ncbi:MAG: PLDc N-terminal domain-containing protein, partial [Rhodocyclaceae bacterium]|nr:PLDc N-terminal domain-containing protein [Rhodocyclaceae bacterium]
MHDIEWLIIAYFVFELIGLAMAGRAVMTARTPQGAIAWAISLVAFPLLSVPLYLVFGRRRLERNVAARRTVVNAIELVLAELEQRASTHDSETSELRKGYLGPLARLTRFPIVGGNDAQLLIDGEATFEA